MKEIDRIEGREFVRGNQKIYFKPCKPDGKREVLLNGETIEYSIYESEDGSHRKIRMLKDGEPRVRFTMAENYIEEMAKWLFDRNVDYEEEDNELYDAEEIEVKLYDAGHESELTEEEIEIVRERM